MQMTMDSFVCIWVQASEERKIRAMDTLLGNDSVMKEQYYTPRQISEKYNISTGTISTACHSGQLRFVKLGGAVRIAESAIAEWIKKEKTTIVSEVEQQNVNKMETNAEQNANM